MEETNFPLLILFVTFKSEKSLYLDLLINLESCITALYLRLNNNIFFGFFCFSHIS